MSKSTSKLDRNENGWATIRMRFSPEEVDLIEVAARVAGQPVVPYIYRCIKWEAEREVAAWNAAYAENEHPLGME